MADPVGFAILSHGDQRQLRRLVDGLNLHYGDPPIACHHDFSQAPLDTTLFPSNVRFVVPPYRTDGVGGRSSRAVSKRSSYSMRMAAPTGSSC
jgi:hypothetical protein